jgi:hypothetical protein
MEVLEKPKVSDMAVDELVKLYVAFRDRRSVRTKEYETADAADKAKLEKLEGRLLSIFAASGTESTRTQFGTAYKTKVAYASIGDKDVFMQHVRGTEAFDLLDVRVSKTAVKQHLDNNEELPPGVNWREEVHIRVNRA